MKTRLTPLVLALCLLTSSTGMLAARASANMVTVGTVATGDSPQGSVGNICSAIQCNNDNGCSNISNRYTEWWPSGQCQHIGGGSVCTVHLMKCRHDIHYSGYFGNCSGTVTDETWHNEPGCFTQIDSSTVGQNNGQTTSTSAD